MFLKYLKSSFEVGWCYCQGYTNWGKMLGYYANTVSSEGRLVSTDFLYGTSQVDNV